MNEEPLLAKEVKEKTKLMLKYAKNNKKDMEVMVAAMELAGVYNEDVVNLVNGA